VGLHALTAQRRAGSRHGWRTVQEGKSWLAAGSAFSHAIVSTAFVPGKSFDDALHDTAKALRGNPTWLHALFPEVDFSKGSLATSTKATNIAGDFLLLRKPAFTGESIAAEIFQAP